MRGPGSYRLLLSGSLSFWFLVGFNQGRHPLSNSGRRGSASFSDVSCQLLISSSQSGYICYHHLQAQFLPCGPSSMVPALAVVSPWEPQGPCWVHGNAFINFIQNPIVVYLPLPARTVAEEVNQVKPGGKQPKQMKQHVQMPWGGREHGQLWVSASGTPTTNHLAEEGDLHKDWIM